MGWVGRGGDGDNAAGDIGVCECVCVCVAVHMLKFSDI